jgi:hypothetical protein
LLGATLLLGTSGTEAAPRRQSASQLIDAVNQFRAASGMGPLTVDPILMQLAQEQSDYNASTGELSHYGPSGRLTRDDAIAAGYGGGSTVFVSENIAVGSDLTEAEAVQMWTGDEPHLNTMLGQYYRDVGAGAEERNGEVYYTLVTGYVAGGFSANSTVPAAVEPLPVRQPLITVTPLPDGSIIHVVAEGQTLWTIAAIYGLDLSQLLSLNGMTEDSFVVPGQEIVVRASPTATAPTPPSATPSASPGPPTVNSPTPTPAPMGASLLARAAEVNPREILGGGCIAAWIILVIAGLVVAARRL